MHPRPIWLRLTAVAVILGGAVIATALALMSLLVLPPEVVLVEFGFVVLALGAICPVLAGRWGPGAWVAPQGLAVGVVLVACVAFALYCGEQAREGLFSRSVHATPTSEILAWTGMAVTAMLAAAVVLGVLPVRLGRRLRVAFVSVLVLTGLAGAGTAVAVAAGGDPCDGFRFDPAAWRSDGDRERVGEALARCDFLHGRTRDEVDELLGGRFINSRERSYVIGFQDDWLGWGSDKMLDVSFGDDLRVRSTGIGYSRR